MKSDNYVLILAGGSGERFWPLSRKSRPKQLLALFSEFTLLEETLRRVENLVPPENILILTNREQEEAVRKLLPKLAAENIIAEPAKRDTAAAIALGAALIAKRNPSATMLVLPADHVIRDQVAFEKTVQVACAAAEQTLNLVTIGIRPTWACPGFGYVELGEKIEVAEAAADVAVFEAASFREKPDAERAKTFLTQGNFRWNAGMFIWTLPSILQAFEKDAPALAEFIAQIRVAKNLGAFLDEHFATLPKISIDYAIMEKAERVLVVEAAFDWDDVGGWDAVAKYLEQHSSDNSANAVLTTIDARGNIVYAEKNVHVALMGVSDLIIVQTGDALMVCSRAEAERIKNLVAKIPTELQ